MFPLSISYCYGGSKCKNGVIKRKKRFYIGLNLPNNGPQVSHIFYFDDDSLLGKVYTCKHHKILGVF